MSREIGKGRQTQMKRHLGAFVIAALLLVSLFAAETALAQKPGGILKMYTVDSPASMSILEEATVFAERPMIGVFNNLVMFDQHVKQNSLRFFADRAAKKWPLRGSLKYAGVLLAYPP